jgi:hypothetical protein
MDRFNGPSCALRFEPPQLIPPRRWNYVGIELNGAQIKSSYLFQQ